MIQVDTDKLEEIHHELKILANDSEENWNLASMLINEMENDIEFLSIPGSGMCLETLREVKRFYGLQKDILFALEKILADVSENYKNIEKHGKERIENLTECVIGMVNNINASFLVHDIRQISLGIQEKYVLKSDSTMQFGRIDGENLAAITKILEEYYCYHEVSDEFLS